MRIVVAGAGEVGSHLAKMLSQENHDIILIDPDEEKLKVVTGSYDVLTRIGSATSINLLVDADIKKSDLFIAVTTREETNITASILSKRLGAAKTIARIDNQEYLLPKYKEHFLNMGVDYMIYPEKIASRELLGLIQQSGTTEIVDFSGGKLSLFVIKIESDAPIVDKTIREAHEIVQKDEYRTVAITRDGNTIVPKGDQKFNAGDLVYIVSNQGVSSDFVEFSGKKKYDIRNIMILGGSRIGMLTAKELGNQHNVKLIELDRSKSYRLSNYLNNTLVINGDGRNMNLLLEEGLKNMDAFIAVTGDSETNILSSVVAKNFGVKKTIAEVENMDYIALAENMGIDTIINKKLITASRIFRFTASESVSAVKCLTGTDAEVMEFIAKPKSKITQGPLNSIEFPNNSMIGGVVRGKSSFIANGNTQIKPDDRVVVFAMPSAINKVGKLFS